MKIYNPFKPHIIKKGEFYKVRRLHPIFGWEYLGTDFNVLSWWGNMYYFKHIYSYYPLEMERAIEKYKKQKIQSYFNNKENFIKQ